MFNTVELEKHTILHRVMYLLLLFVDLFRGKILTAYGRITE